VKIPKIATRRYLKELEEGYQKEPKGRLFVPMIIANREVKS
jgi:hypothetical protein